MQITLQLDSTAPDTQLSLKDVKNVKIEQIRDFNGTITTLITVEQKDPEDINKLREFQHRRNSALPTQN